MPKLSDAAQVLHTNPKLYYIPKHKHLGKYNDEYGGELYMIEERPEDNYSNDRNFGYADDIESTHDIIEKIRKDEEYKNCEGSRRIQIQSWLNHGLEYTLRPLIFDYNVQQEE